MSFRLSSFIHFKVLFSCVLCLLSCVSFSQTWNWAKGEGDIGNDAANSITLDDSRNAYVTGNFAGRADFSGTMYQGKGLYEVFIAKYDPQGNLLWLKTAGGDDNDQGNSIRFRKGFLYLTGFFHDTAWFESTMLLSRGDADAFTAKYDLDGNLIWVKQAGGVGFDYGSSVDADNDGNVYIGGTYETSMTLDTTSLSSNNLYNESFYGKYDSSGNLVWAKSTVGNNANLITGLAFDNNHSIFLTGYFGGSFKVGTATINSSTPSYDIFLAKVDDAGNLQWMKRAGSNYEDASHAVCSDMNGNPSITGYFAGTATFGTNSVTYFDYNDIFIARYDSSGNNLWVRAGKGNKLDVAFAIAADDNGNVFSTGMYQNTVDFDGHTISAPSLLDRDIFVVSYSKDGNFHWLTGPGGVDTDCGLGIDVADNGMVALTGYYIYSCSFGNISIDNAQANDLFVAEYTPPIINDIAEEEPEKPIALYPNPCSSRLVIDVPNETHSVANIFDAYGKMINSMIVYERSITLNTSNYPDGLYFLSLENEEGASQKRFIVAH